MDSAVVLLSGGIGSSVAAFRHRETARIHPLYVNYGRPSADRERAAAADIASALETKVCTIDLAHVIQIARSCATDVGNAASRRRPELGGPSEIPGLSATLLAVGMEYAAAVGAKVLVTGTCATAPVAGKESLSKERIVDPREFHHAAAALIEAALPSVRPVRLEVPFLDLSPRGVLQLGRRFGVPFEQTWSCHCPGPPCGTCAGCVNRAAAFSGAGVADPLQGSGPVRQLAAQSA